MNAHDWLRNLPLVDTDSQCRVIEVSFSQGARKDFFRNPSLQQFEKGDLIAVEGVGGFDVGEVSLTGEIVRLQLKKRGVKEENLEMKKVLRLATDRDLELLKQNKSREPEAVIRSRAIAKQLRLDMKISQVEMQADGRKATFFYIADGRVDFRELIKVYASEFKVKVEMRQIGARQEAGKVGGIGSCGRELCCCLNYELDTYLDALQHFPDNCDVLQVAKGNAFLIKKDIFKNLMWYTLPDSNKQYPLTLERVRKIKELNKQGVRPEELEPVEITSSKPKEDVPEFVELVGQFSLKTLDRAAQRKRQQQQQQRNPRNNNNSGGNKPGGPQRPSGPSNRGPQRPPQNQPRGPRGNTPPRKEN